MTNQEKEIIKECITQLVDSNEAMRMFMQGLATEGFVREQMLINMKLVNDLRKHVL